MQSYSSSSCHRLGIWCRQLTRTRWNEFSNRRNQSLLREQQQRSVSSFLMKGDNYEQERATTASHGSSLSTKSTTSLKSNRFILSSLGSAMPCSPLSFDLAQRQQQHPQRKSGMSCRSISGTATASYQSTNSTFLAAATTEMPATVPVSIEEAQTMTTQALRQIGWDKDDATLQAKIMVAAELCGNNQGLVKMYNPQLMAPAPNAGKPIVERDTPSSAVINANQAPGMLAAVMAADLVAQKLLTTTTASDLPLNIAVVSAYNTSTSSGQLAFYVERIARQGLIGISLCNSPEFVAAAPGGKPVFGTNPLAVGIPQAGDAAPFTFDMATSAIALFGVLSAKAKGEPLPQGVAYGKDGNTTTDAAEALDGGAIATFGGHKGAGLSLVVELLAGALSGGAVLGQVESKKMAKSWGHTFIAIRPQALTDNYEAKVTSILEAVKASGDNIRIPGERSAQTAAERRAAGVMPIPTKIWESILRTAQEGLPKTT